MQSVQQSRCLVLAYLSDAFTALAGEFVAAATAKATGREKLLNAATKVGKSLAIHGVRYAVKAATLGVVDTMDIKGLAEGVAKDAGDSATRPLPW